MSQDKFTQIVQPDPRLLDAFCTDFNEGLRETVRTIKPLPHRIFRQIGDTLNPGYTPGRVILCAKGAGAPLSHLEEPFHRAIAFVRSLFPTDSSRSVHAASIEEQRADGPFDLWQASLTANPSEFELRRGIALAVEQRRAIDHAIDSMQHELARVRSLQFASRMQLQSKRVAR